MMCDEIERTEQLDDARFYADMMSYPTEDGIRVRRTRIISQKRCRRHQNAATRRARPRAHFSSVRDAKT
jgi:hypothetical protein